MPRLASYLYYQALSPKEPSVESSKSIRKVLKPMVLSMEASSGPMETKELSRRF